RLFPLRNHHDSALFDRPSAKAMIVAVFTALSLATDYALIGFQNIKLMDVLVFIVSFLFGVRLGVAVAVPTWLVYGLVNPNGVDDPVTLSFLIIGECFYALSGGILRRTSVGQEISNMKPIARVEEIVPETGVFRRVGHRLRSLNPTPSLVFAFVGLQATFGYDLLTNFASWLFLTSSLYQAFIIGNIVGVPFSIAHEGSNMMFFATVAPAVIVAARRMGLGLPTRVQPN
ncbi:MAG TPA: hypothetical protein VFE96_05810, partial [Candidatus Bathyarchaeia archaeon]|nr:hypothetical protein [Candidatus Bathyarchaeia archaeon]